MGPDYSLIKKNVRRARKLVIRATTAAGSGHPGGSFSMAEIIGCLLHGHARVRPSEPGWEDRDRIVLSKGHAAPGLFAGLAVAGFIEESETETLRALGSRLQGHPDLKCPGVEFCGGSLGTGLSFSVGAALAARLDGSGRRIYAVLGDGETDEGQVWEAAMAASKYGLDNLTAILDRNLIQQDSYTERVMPLDGPTGSPTQPRSDPSVRRVCDKWRAFGWNVLEADGHRVEQVSCALDEAARSAGSPSIVIARTVKGRSVEHMEDNPAWHGKAASADVVPLIFKEIDSEAAIAPSIIAGDMSDLEGTVRRCAEGGADWIHLDVMDGKFVPASTFGHETVARLRPVTDLPFDTHLMIAEPARHARAYAEAGSDMVTVHAEACDEAEFGAVRDALRSAGAGLGLAVNPGTEFPGWAERFAPELGQVIVMSVEPGRAGQKYIQAAHAKTAALALRLSKLGFAGTIEADGGVGPGNAGECFADGARAFVGGSAIAGRPDVGAAVAEFRAAVKKARRSAILAEAHRLGGAELVSKWISLHEIGDAASELKALARETGCA